MFIRRVAAVILAVSAVAVVRGSAQEPARTDQTFRTGVDVIRLDVTVLGGARWYEDLIEAVPARRAE